MHNNFAYFVNALLFLGIILFLQLIYKFDIADIWRLFVSDGSVAPQNLSLSEPFESSVWCHTDSDSHRQCSFKNLCFSPLHRQFIFILTSNSTLSGVKNKQDLTSLELSSVSNHNKFMLKLAIVSTNDIILRGKVISKNFVFLLWRFKMDNIMHLIHDDLLPLFSTYLKLCMGNVEHCTSKYRLAFVDEEGIGPFHDWYKVFSKHEPLLLASMKESLVCFEEAQTGLTRSSVWFQYGFRTHQGPTNNSEVTKNLINHFAKFILHNLDVRPGTDKEFTRAVLFNRQINRKIVNYEFVMESMKESFSKIFPYLPKLEVCVLDLSVNNSMAVLSILSTSKLLVGMHGAEMMLAIFLPANSAVVELFPFGIIPSHVSPLKSLINITSGLIYESWENLDEQLSQPHPEAPILQGGIQHLPRTEQLRIQALIPIPAVPCCHDPAYLYRMFQDTTVGDNLSPLLQRALRRLKRLTMKPESHENVMQSQWWFPGPISNVSCEFSESQLIVKWDPPLNVKGVVVKYEVTIFIGGQILEFSSNVGQLVIPTEGIGSPANIWIKCLALDFKSESIDSFTTCMF